MDLVWITKAKYVRGYTLHLEFNNGVSGNVDLNNCLSSQLYAPLKDTSVFKQFKQNSWTIEWNGKLDFAPEYLYQLVLQQN